MSFPLAILLHSVVLVSMGFAQYWNVEQVPDPQLNAPGLIIEAELPAPPAGPKPSHPAPTHTEAQPSKPQPAITQPQNIPLDPVKPAAPEPDPGPVTPAPSPNQGSREETSGSPDSNCTGPHCIGIGKGTDSGPAIVDAAPLQVGGAVTKPVVLERVEPQYTEMARRVRLEGTVIVEAIIDESGRVVNVKVLKGLPMGLDQAAVDAVSRWRFKPATFHDRAVKVYYSLTVNFRVQ
ncbi:MAG TPA: energy transducer TonB [Thermoanaerobaculia bacterium]|nr:energy transducer TonB [Thermoanaerobaculia bacterium]